MYILIIILYVLYYIYMLHLDGGNARLMDGTTQHLVATKQARIILLLFIIML